MVAIAPETKTELPFLTAAGMLFKMFSVPLWTALLFIVALTVFTMAVTLNVFNAMTLTRTLLHYLTTADGALPMRTSARLVSTLIGFTIVFFMELYDGD